MTERTTAPERPRRGFGAFLIWLSGANKEVLDLTPSDRPKFQGMGGAVLTTALLAGLSMFFAVRMTVTESTAGALVVSLVWFGAILNLDRWLVSSLQRSAGRWGFLRIAVPRLLLAVLFGVVISTPLVLQVFDSEVRTEIAKIRQSESEKFQAALENGPTSERIKALEKEEKDLLAVVQSGGTVVNVEADPEIAALRDRLKPLEKQRDDFADKATCELTGDRCKGTSGNSGSGPRYDNYVKKRDRAEREIRDINRQIAAKAKDLRDSSADSKEQVLGEARQKLTGVQADLEALRGTQADERATFQETNAENTGLLIRLDALGKASSGNSTLFWARFLLFLLITTLECLPIIVKMMALLGRPGPYDRMLEVYDEQALLSGKQKLRTRRATSAIHHGDELSYADHLRGEREKTTRALAQATAQAEYEIGQRALELWRQDMMRDLHADPARFVQSGGQAPPAGPPPLGFAAGPPQPPVIPIAGVPPQPPSFRTAAPGEGPYPAARGRRRRSRWSWFAFARRRP